MKRRVEDVEGLGAEEGFGVGRVLWRGAAAAEVERGELGPIGEAHVDRAGGCDCGWVVGAGAGDDGDADGCVAAGLIDDVGTAGGAEAGGGDAQGLEDAAAHEVFPGDAEFHFGHVAGDGGVGVGVFEGGAGGRLWRVFEDAKEERAAAFEGVLDACEAWPECVAAEVGGDAGVVREELKEGDVFPGWVDAIGGEFRGEDVGDGGVPTKRALFDEDGAEGCGHGFGAGAEVEEVVDGDGGVAAAGSDACGGVEADGVAFDEDRGETGSLVLLADGGEEGGDIARGGEGIGGSGGGWMCRGVRGGGAGDGGEGAQAGGEEGAKGWTMTRRVHGPYSSAEVTLFHASEVNHARGSFVESERSLSSAPE